ncbi:hypothetical protein QR680_012369 [Steinernema hermaphroditum]|uniref:Translation initiation factor eIF2B subunit alpha n=1 Tax=Steinernema hermaphroditum TaxID=289476 RepID=A0AA39I1T8_9BILA|nr:hypothetical protein QR680_012369 [Steinernema hermaphroditum]
MVAEHSAKEFFSSLLSGDEDNRKSTGLAAIETLMMCIEASNVATVNELVDELKKAIAAMSETDYSRASVRSASELFLRFISLTSSEVINRESVEGLVQVYRKRGKDFIERVGQSRKKISSCARPFLKSGMKVMTHSFSKVVLEALVDAHKEGLDMHVYTTESQPDESGRRAHEYLKKAGIPSILILDSAVGYLMESVDMVLVGAEGVMETGGIINKASISGFSEADFFFLQIGTLSMAVCAHAFNKPVYVMSESIKFVKEYPLNQSDIPDEFKYHTSTLKRSKPNLQEEHPLTDYTPPQFIKLLFTDLGILTPAAVGDELIKLYT